MGILDANDDNCGYFDPIQAAIRFQRYRLDRLKDEPTRVV
jgi:hypothetical protein